MTQTPNTFFCGTQYGRVRQADAQNWNEFFDKYLATPIPLRVTRQQYATLGDREKKDVKKVPYYTSARFARPVSDRQTQNAVACSLITLDIDDAAPASYLLGNLPLVESTLKGHNYVLHHTTSSQPQHPRLRLVVEAKDIPLSRYPAAVHTLQQMLKLERIDPSSDKMVQPMYRPSCFLDEDPRETNPIILSAKNGRPFTEDRISGERIAGANAPSRAPNPSAPAPAEPDEDALDHLRNPVDNISLDTVASTLAALDPDMDYGPWLSVAAGLKHQFHRTPEEEEAFDLFNDWSAQGQKYTTLEETRAKWDSFAHTPKGRAPATFRSVLHMAKEAGYTPPPQPATADTATDTPTDASPPPSSAKELADITFNQLVALRPQPSPLEMMEAMTNLARAIKTIFKINITPAALHREYKALVRANSNQTYTAQRNEAIAQNDGEFPVPEWVEPMVYLSNQTKFFDTKLKLAYGREAFNATFGEYLTPTAEQADDPAQLSRPRTLPSDYATNEIRIPKVYDLQYRPECAEQAIVEHDGIQYANSYRKDYTPANAKTAEAEGTLFLKHLHILIKEPEHIATILNIFAHLVQHPGVRVNYCLFIQGAPGCGKSQLARCAAMTVGATNSRIVSVDELETPYNSYAVGKQLVIMEEIRVKGKSKDAVMRKLLPLITNPRIAVNEKNRKGVEDENKAFYIALSNHKDALAVERNDRRFFVLNSPLQSGEEVRAIMDTGHFDEVEAMLQADTGGLRHFLLSYPIAPGFKPGGHAPRTRYFEEMFAATSNEHALDLRDIISDDENPLVKRDLISVSHMIEALQNAPGVSRHTPLSGKFASYLLSEEGYEHFGRRRVNGTQHSLWVRSGTAKSKDWVALAHQRVAAALDTAARDHFSSEPDTTTLQQDIDDLL